ncbi:MAG TPA: hypothetical protein DCG34_08095 [Clostridiales bacterium]|jgi:hypothetical protein|nr:hypothetical protein [Clostridiales bacterium]
MKLLNSIKTTAQLSGLGEHTIRKLVRTDPTFPHIKVGETVVKINYKAFSEWLEQVSKEGRSL